VDQQPELALKYYKKALEQCKDMGLDPYSDEVLGVRIQIAAWLEKINHFEQSIATLESILHNCLRWVDWFEAGIEAGTIDKSGIPPPPPPPPRADDMKEGGMEINGAVEKTKEEAKNDDEEIEIENLWHKRTRLLTKAVSISTKLGELYADEHVMDGENAMLRSTFAVETALKESRRRITQGQKPEEGDWLTPEQIGGALESSWSRFTASSPNAKVLTLASSGTPVREQISVSHGTSSLPTGSSTLP
jgi:hypothetical protein